MNNYTPKPIDTTDVVLTDDLLSLVEVLAESTHDVWALGRLNDGWRYGSARDDAARTHPCLVPYAGLPESEKAYDRNTAMETIKALVALGYTIEKKA